MGLAILLDTEGACETAVPMPVSRHVRRNDAPRRHGPYEIDDEELAEMLAAAEEAEVSPLCFL